MAGHRGSTWGSGFSDVYFFGGVLLVFRLSGLVFRVSVSVSGFGGSGFRVRVLGFRVWRFGVWFSELTCTVSCLVAVEFSRIRTHDGFYCA